MPGIGHTAKLDRHGGKIALRVKIRTRSSATGVNRMTWYGPATTRVNNHVASRLGLRRTGGGMTKEWTFTGETPPVSRPVCAKCRKSMRLTRFAPSDEEFIPPVV